MAELQAAREQLTQELTKAREDRERAQLSVANLELVLNQFEADKESHITAERRRMQSDVAASRDELQAALAARDEMAKRLADLQQSQGKAVAMQADMNVLQGINTALQHDVQRLQAQLNEAHARLTQLLASTGSVRRGVLYALNWPLYASFFFLFSFIVVARRAHNRQGSDAQHARVVFRL